MYTDINIAVINREYILHADLTDLNSDYNDLQYTQAQSEFSFILMSVTLFQVLTENFLKFLGHLHSVVMVRTSDFGLIPVRFHIKKKPVSVDMCYHADVTNRRLQLQQLKSTKKSL
jgi:hypothetical protein